mmetsp:Transcript_16815/g.40552  ORF Transcript_16815/g.40552 Transcript_16815/m.40552 type:complete len:236 (+) Transcript_16815:621-1328(+)
MPCSQAGVGQSAPPAPTSVSAVLLHNSLWKKGHSSSRCQHVPDSYGLAQALKLHRHSEPGYAMATVDLHSHQAVAQHRRESQSPRAAILVSEVGTLSVTRPTEFRPSDTQLCEFPPANPVDWRLCSRGHGRVTSQMGIVPSNRIFPGKPLLYEPRHAGCPHSESAVHCSSPEECVTTPADEMRPAKSGQPHSFASASQHPKQSLLHSVLSVGQRAPPAKASELQPCPVRQLNTTE